MALELFIGVVITSYSIHYTKLYEKEIGVCIESVKPVTGRPTDKKEIIKRYIEKTPKEISEITEIPLKTVEYHYYKLKKIISE